MKVLVTSASKHGATRDIANAIGAELGSHGLDVTMAPVQDVASITEYDAVILGSAVYLGKWMKPARQFTTDHASELATRVVWLFSSGPIPSARSTGDYSYEQRHGDEIANAIGAREHRLFLGKARPKVPERPRASPGPDREAARR
jgi:menaquinone-dependent protoporphyrinogen oxidase